MATIVRSYTSPWILEELIESSERAAVIVGVALIEDALKLRIRRALPPLDTDKDKVFKFPLGNLSAKIAMADRMKLIDNSNLLNRLRHLRNEYAHVAEIDSTAFRLHRNRVMNEVYFLEETENEIQGSISGNFLELEPNLSRMAESSFSDLAFRLSLVAIVSRLNDVRDDCSAPSVQMDVMATKGIGVHFDIDLWDPT